VGFSTDLIVGFPTETEEEFQETMSLLDAVEYDNIYAFAYSPRPGTRAAKLPDDVPNDVKNKRLNTLLQHQLTIAKRRYAERVGNVMEVLVEGQAKHQNMIQADAAGERVGRVWTGRTTCNRVVNFIDTTNRNYLGQFLMVKITGSSSLSLAGELVHDASFAERNDGSVKYTSSYSTSEIVQ
jgi:tRNA-2-methylthio-N6-dimethylallyladenosine synthase